MFTTIHAEELPFHQRKRIVITSDCPNCGKISFNRIPSTHSFANFQSALCSKCTRLLNA